jgi:hypothetical protein
MKKFFQRRLIIYPAISSLCWYLIFMKYSGSSMLNLIEDEINYMIDILPFSLPPPLIILLFGLSFGYVYGTISIIVKVRQFKGTFFILIFIFKVMFSTMLAVSIGIFAYFIEIAILPILLHVLKKIKKNKHTPTIYKTKDKDDLIKEMEKLIVEYKKVK